jgi:hypothetical protein
MSSSSSSFSSFSSSGHNSSFLNDDSLVDLLHESSLERSRVGLGEEHGEWLGGVNERLVANGFRAIQLDSDPDAAKNEADARQLLVGRLFAVLDQYARRGQRIEELMTRRTAAPPSSSSSSALEQGGANARRRAEKSDELERTVTELNEEATRVRKANSSEVREMRASIRELKLQLKQSEHRVKAKETVAERLAERFKAQVDRERQIRERDRKAFVKLQRRPVGVIIGCDCVSLPCALSLCLSLS